MSKTVRSAQRFSVRAGRPCPGCGGGHDLLAGRGQRCYGFLHDDPRYFTCTRRESHRQSGEGWQHFRGEAGCRCGRAHGCDPASAMSSSWVGKHFVEVDRIERAREAWRKAQPIGGSTAEGYLRRRGITVPLPPTLRAAPALRHAPSERTFPAMVAAITGVDPRTMGIHRTYLTPDGLAKAPVVPQKMMLGRVGGLSVHLAPATERMAVAEGIETALSVQQATGIATWAALSAGGIRLLALPPLPLGGDIVIAADADDDGRKAATDAGRRWLTEGRDVRIVTPPDGTDFNDVLRGRHGR